MNTRGRDAVTDTDSPALHGRTVLISGASRGIGHGIALACARAGAEVVACGRDVAALEKLADAIAADGGPAARLLPINLERAGVDDYTAIADHLQEQCGGLDGLVINAAMLGELSPLTHYDPPTWARVFQVNVHSAFLLLQACAGLLCASGRGALIFTLAGEGLQAKPNWGAYAVSKYALHGLMAVASAEFAASSELRVQAVVPPPSHTDLRMLAFPAAPPASLARADSVAGLYVALLADGGGHPHGAIIDAANGKHWTPAA